ncbi:hypothetical protein pdul_cds_1017 [Pandoravirus dulcis]|uniref:Uncharacterized protein n=1 Tax=Pandoravirus dulcis TaxID=1349409 RepID=S4VSK4_9VIRU|nr:hypothetical protein pdul_cds_1017 [Pandoravirus dulcis]AGO83287.1 hypothetical protein pdul_cds_1017 [Pandoravirus dulcis]
MQCTRRVTDDRGTARQAKERKKAVRVARAARRRGAPDALPALVAMLQERRRHHAMCMGAMPVAAAVALWRSGADTVSDEAAVRVALDAGHAIVALAMLEATTPFALVGTVGDTGRDAAADVDRICRRLSSHMAQALRPREVWRVIVTWEVGGRRFRRKMANPSAPGDGTRAVVSPDFARPDSPARDAREMRRAWRFLLRFRLVAFLGALAKASTEAELARFWETSAPQTRAHVVEIVLGHAERTLRLAERPHCQRVWAEAAAATASRSAGRHCRKTHQQRSPGVGLLPAMRGAVASLRNAALWAARAQDAAHAT